MGAAGCGCAGGCGCTAAGQSAGGDARSAPVRAPALERSPGSLAGATNAGAPARRALQVGAATFGQSTRDRTAYSRLFASLPGPRRVESATPPALRELLGPSSVTRVGVGSLLADELTDDEWDAITVSVRKLRPSGGIETGRGGFCGQGKMASGAEADVAAANATRTVGRLTLAQAGKSVAMRGSSGGADSDQPASTDDPAHPGPDEWGAQQGVEAQDADSDTLVEPRDPAALGAPEAKSRQQAAAGLGSGPGTRPAHADVSGECFEFAAYERTSLPNYDDCYNIGAEGDDDWQSKKFRACAVATYAEAVTTLKGVFGDAWETSLWALVDSGEVVSSATIDANLAPIEVAPLWYSWDAKRTKYTPEVDDLPRRAVMRRALWMILKYPEGIQEDWDGQKMRELVVDPIAAGAMSYRIYDRVLFGDWELYGTQIDKAWSGLADAWDRVVQAADAAGDKANEPWPSEKDKGTWTNTDLVELYRQTLEEIGAAMDDLERCFLNPDDCGDLLAGTGDYEDLGTTLYAWMALLDTWGEPLLADMALFLREVFDALLTFRALIKELEAWLMAEDVEELIMELFVRTAQCVGPANQYLDARPTPERIHDCKAACGHNQGTKLYGTIEFTWGFENADGSAADPKQSVNPGCNHGVMGPRFTTFDFSSVNRDYSDHPATQAYGNRVWYCATLLDRAAIVYDWYVSVATRIFATLPSIDPETPEYTHTQLAANHCLRMALGVAAEWAGVVVHETGHNGSLWHCSEPDEISGKKVSCAQDVARLGWLTNVVARMGLPWANHRFGRLVEHDHWSHVYWKVQFGTDAGDDDSIDPMETGGWDVLSESLHDLWSDYQPYRLLQLECIGNLNGDSDASTTLEDIGDVLDTLGTVFSIADKLGIEVEHDLSSPFWQLGALFHLIAGEEALWTDYESAQAYLTFHIDYPLNPGGSVTWACISHQNTCCVASGGGGRRALWETDLPTGYQGCCSEIWWLDGDARAEGACP